MWIRYVHYFSRQGVSKRGCFHLNHPVVEDWKKINTLWILPSSHYNVLTTCLNQIDSLVGHRSFRSCPTTNSCKRFGLHSIAPFRACRMHFWKLKILANDQHNKYLFLWGFLNKFVKGFWMNTNYDPLQSPHLEQFTKCYPNKPINRWTSITNNINTDRCEVWKILSSI